MTKKSASRLARDQAQANNQRHMANNTSYKGEKEALKNNTCWDDLNGIYTGVVQMLATHASISQLANNKELIGAIVNKTALIENIRSLANDLREMHNRLNGIYSLHKDKTGGSNDPDVVFSTITIAEQYNKLMEDHEGVIAPTAYYILEQFDQAEKILMAAQRVNTDLADPKVISDVEVISEVKVGEVITAGEAVLDTIDSTEKSNAILGVDFIKAVHESVTKPNFAELTESFKKLHPDVGVSNVQVTEQVNG